MSYQDRKDIDALFDLVWDNNNNQTQFTTREEFEEFKKYIKLNYSMSAFIDALASNMDENGIVLFENLQDGLNELETNLDGLENNLGELTLQLNGDENNVGFIGLLQQLQYNLYGEGETKENGDPYTYEDPMSDSLKGLLDSFLVQLGALSAGDTKLSATLSSLSSKLQRFSGTIDDFRDSIDPSLLETLDPYMVDLIYEIASSNEAIYQHQQTIDETEALIGLPTDSASNQGTPQNPVTIFGRLNDTSDIASQSNDSANGLLDLMYRGTGNDYNPNADPEHPADNTTLQWLGDTSTTVNKVDGYVGDVSKFTEATISEALKNRADGQTAINNKIGNVSYTGSNITGAIASMQTKIGTVNFTGNSISHALNTMQTQIGSVNVSGSLRSDINSLQTQIGSVNFNGGTVTNALSSLQTQIGDVNVNGSLTSAIESLQTNIGNVSLLNGSSISLSIYNSQVNIGNIQGNIGNVNLFTGNTISSALGNAQSMIGNVNVSSDGSLQTQITQLPAYLDEMDVAMSQNGDPITKMNIGAVPIVRFKVSELGKKAIRDNGSFTVTLKIIRPDNSVTSIEHTISSHSQGYNYLFLDGGFTRHGLHKFVCGTISFTVQVGDFAPLNNFRQVMKKTMYGLDVIAYSDSLNVYLVISGTLDGSANLPNDGNRSYIGTFLGNDTYAPPYEMQSTVHSANMPNWSRITVKPNGEVYFQNGVNSKSYSLECSFYYPLKSRMPSSS